MESQIPCLERVKWINLPSHVDERGVLTSIEGEIDTPFKIRRVFYMHHINSDRGDHVHLETDQMIIATSGSFNVNLSDGKTNKTYKVHDPKKGLYVPRMIFIKLRNFTKNAVCLVLASTHYDIKKSIRNWNEYIKIIDY